MAKPKSTEIKKVYRLIVDGRPYKFYHNEGHMKNAIHGFYHSSKIEVEVYELRAPLIIDASIIMGGVRCPECHEWPHKNGDNHRYDCSLDPRNCRVN